MILDEGVLKGLLKKLTIPANGRASATYVSTDGQISLSAKNWSAVNPETGALTATLKGTGKYSDWLLEVVAAADWTVEVVLSNADGVVGTASLTGIVWSADNKATAYKGYYTVTLPVTSLDAEADELAYTGSGYVTIDITSANALKKGEAKWAGILPNGTAISGTIVLTPRAGVASMPIYYSSSKDVVAGVVEILENAESQKEESAVYLSVTSADGISWSHIEPEGSEASFTATLSPAGGLLDSSDSLEECCIENFSGTTNMWLSVEGTDDATIVTIGTSSVKVDKTANPLSASLGYKAKTGILRGSVKVDGKTLTLRGVVLVGIGGCNACSAGSGETSYPLFNCTAWRTESVVYEAKGVGGKPLTRKLNVKCGVKAKIDSEKEFE